MRGVILWLILVGAGASQSALAQPRDAGTDAGATDAGPDANPAVARRSAQRDALRARVEALEATVLALAGLEPDAPVVPDALAGVFDIDTSDPEAAQRRIAELGAALPVLEDRRADHAAIVEALGAHASEDPVAGLRRELAALELAEAEAELARARAMQAFLAASQSARIEAQGQRDALDLEIQQQKAQAEREARAAQAESAQAAQERAAARSQPEQLLGDERGRLAAVAVAQARYRQRLVEDKKQLAAIARRHVALLESIRSGAVGEAADAQYRQIMTELARVQTAGLDDAAALLGGLDEVPHPGTRLAPALDALPSVYDSERAALERQRQRLVGEAGELGARARRVYLDRANLLLHQSEELIGLRLAMLPRLTPALRSAVRGFGEPAREAMRVEASQLALQGSMWALERTRQLRGAPAVLLGDLGELGALVWRLLEVLLVLAVLRFALRRWHRWMTSLVAVLGRSVDLGSGALMLARLAESARHFGPALLVVVATVSLYWLLGGGTAPIEVRIVFVFVFWTSLLRLQLRIAESVARVASQRAAERARDRHELELDAQSAADDDRTREPPIDDDDGGAGTVALFSRSWRIVTGYLAIVIILRELARLAVGPGAFHSLVGRVAVLAAPLVGLWLLRMWRPRIVTAYLSRAGAARGSLARLAERHASRFYGVFVVAAVFGVLLVRRVLRFGRDHLSNLDSTKRVLAFLFRRRVEKHAQEHGRVLEKPHSLPRAIQAQFTVGPLDADELPLRLPLVDEIVGAHVGWLEDEGDSSVALVGGSGMGKTTALRLIVSRLDVPDEHPVAEGKLTGKIVEPRSMARQVARILELPEAPESLDDLVVVLKSGPRRTVVVDDCHNLFLRRVGGFEAWEAFTRLVNETSGQVFWLLSFNEAAWDYLYNVGDRVSYFRKVVRMPAWTEEQIRRLVLMRMRRSGYRPNFMDLVVARIEGVETAAQVIRTSKGYFRLLWDFTDGNPRLACYFWLRSLVPVEGEKRVRVHLFAAPRIEELEQLPDDVAFALTAVVEHENLNSEELAAAANMPVTFARFSLRFCRERGYLWRNPSTGRTQLALQWQQSIIRYLKRKGLVYS